MDGNLASIECQHVYRTADDLSYLLQCVDEQICLLTEELLPPRRQNGSAEDAMHTKDASFDLKNPQVRENMTQGTSVLSDPVARRERLLRESMASCCRLSENLHAAISQQKPMRTTSSGGRDACVKLMARNMEALRWEMVALQNIRRQNL